jgi:hypothetical protein
MSSGRLFWAGLDPAKSEPLDKVLAALHCFHVAPPSVPDAFYFKFTVNREDHYRIGNGFPELQELVAAISQGHPDSIRWPIPFVSKIVKSPTLWATTDKTPAGRNLTRRPETLQSWLLLFMPMLWLTSVTSATTP